MELQDTEIIDQIDRDVKRTHPDIDFFCGDSASSKANQVIRKKKVSLSFDPFHLTEIMIKIYD